MYNIQFLVLQFNIQSHVCHSCEPTRLLPVNAVYTVFQGHQKPLPHRKLQVFRLCDDQHVWARKGGAEVIQVDPAVVCHQTNTDVTILPTQMR